MVVGMLENILPASSYIQENDLQREVQRSFCLKLKACSYSSFREVLPQEISDRLGVLQVQRANADLTQAQACQTRFNGTSCNYLLNMQSPISVDDARPVVARLVANLQRASNGSKLVEALVGTADKQLDGQRQQMITSLSEGEIEFQGPMLGIRDSRVRLSVCGDTVTGIRWGGLFESSNARMFWTCRRDPAAQVVRCAGAGLFDNWSSLVATLEYNGTEKQSTDGAAVITEEVCVADQLLRIRCVNTEGSTATLADKAFGTTPEETAENIASVPSTPHTNWSRYGFIAGGVVMSVFGLYKTIQSLQAIRKTTTRSWFAEQAPKVALWGGVVAIGAVTAYSAYRQPAVV